MLCNCSSKTLDHVFSGCSYMSWIISKIADVFHTSIDSSFSFHDVLLQIMGKNFSPRVTCIWRFAWVLAFWMVWTHRNNIVHGGEFLPRSRFITQLWIYIKEINLVDLGRNFNSQQDLNYMRRLGMNFVVTRPLMAVPVRWTPPEADWIKVNSDGSEVRGNI